MIERYTKLPEMWRQVLSARAISVADYKISWELLAKGRWASTVKLTNNEAAKMGISAKTRQRVIKRLARWGLIATERDPGKSPRINVRWLAGPQPGGHG